MLYLTCTIISSVGLAHYRLYRAKDWVSVEYGTICIIIRVVHQVICVQIPKINVFILTISVLMKEGDA